MAGKEHCTVTKSPSEEFSLKNRAVVKSLPLAGESKSPCQYVKVTKAGGTFILSLEAFPRKNEREKGMKDGEIGLNVLQVRLWDS